MGLGWLVLSGAALVSKRPARVNPTGLRWAALAGVFFGLDMVFWTTGVMVAGPTKVTLLANTAPLWVGLGAMLIYKERRKPLFWIGLAIALVGSSLVVSPNLPGKGALDFTSLYGMAAALFYGAYFLTAQRGRAEIDALSFVRASTLASTLVLLVAALLLNQPLTGYSIQTIGWFLAMGVVVQAAGWLVISYAQGHLPASIVSPTMLGQPVLTALFSVWLLGERFTLVEAAGGAAVLAGVLLVHRSRSNTK